MLNLSYEFNKAGEQSNFLEEFVGGHVDEHNATSLTLRPDAEFCPGAAYFRLLFDDYVTEELYPDADGVIRYTLPQALTKSRALTFQLAGYVVEGEDLLAIARTDVITAHLKTSLSGGEEACDEALDAMENYLISAKDAAQKAADCRISSADLSDEGYLTLTYADGTTADLGNLKGPKGDTGTISPATSQNLGGVIVGHGLAVENDGTLHTSATCFVTTYEVNTPAWVNQPELVAGDGSVLKTWEEDCYFAHLTENPGEFVLLNKEGDLDSVICDTNGTALTFRFPAGDYKITATASLTENASIDLLSNDDCPVLRNAGVASILHNLAMIEHLGIGPNKVNVSLTADLLNGRFNGVNFNAAANNIADTYEFQCNPTGGNGYNVIKPATTSRASLLIYDVPSNPKKHSFLRLNVDVDMTGGTTWNATLDGTIRFCENGIPAMDSTTALANTYHRTLKHFGYAVPPRDITKDIKRISYSSVRYKNDIRNGSVITIKEMRI